MIGKHESTAPVVVGSTSKVYHDRGDYKEYRSPHKWVTGCGSFWYGAYDWDYELMNETEARASGLRPCMKCFPKRFHAIRNFKRTPNTETKHRHLRWV